MCDARHTSRHRDKVRNVTNKRGICGVPRPFAGPLWRSGWTDRRPDRPWYRRPRWPPIAPAGAVVNRLRGHPRGRIDPIVLGFVPMAIGLHSCSAGFVAHRVALLWPREGTRGRSGVACGGLPGRRRPRSWDGCGEPIGHAVREPALWTDDLPARPPGLRFALARLRFISGVSELRLSPRLWRTCWRCDGA
jgi:hypothetical protein